MQEKVVLTRVYRGEQETQWGVRDKVSIKTAQHGDKWIGALFDPKKGKNGTEDWKEGDTVEVYLTEKGGYTNFTMKPKVGDTSGLEVRIKKLEDAVFGGSENVKEDIPDTAPDQDDF